MNYEEIEYFNRAAEKAAGKEGLCHFVVAFHQETMENHFRSSFVVSLHFKAKRKGMEWGEYWIARVIWLSPGILRNSISKYEYVDVELRMTKLCLVNMVKEILQKGKLRYALEDELGHLMEIEDEFDAVEFPVRL